MTHFETIQEFNEMLGVETLHPMVSVVNLGLAKLMKHMRHTNGFYSVMLKDEKFCDIVYGRSRYDYDKEAVVSTAPGQVVASSRRILTWGQMPAIYSNPSAGDSSLHPS